MKSIRRISILLSVLPLGAAAVLACSDSTERAYIDEAGDADASSTVSLPPTNDAAPTEVDAQTEDAPDARAPFDPTAEAVTCNAQPCATQLVAGQDHFCALMSDKTIRCWGSDDSGALGRGEPSGDATDAGAFKVAQVAGVTNAKQISAAAGTTCAVLDDATIACWGKNQNGELGLSADFGSSDWSSHPLAAPVALTERVLRVDVGQRSACAILETGELWCWGSNEFGQLGRSRDFYIGSPAKVDGLTGKTARATAGSHTSFAVDDEGKLTSWGAVAGAEGSISGRASSLKVDIAPFAVAPGPFISLAASSTYIYFPYNPDPFAVVPPEGVGHACGVVGGVLYCWGESLVGALGVGVPGIFATPVPAPTQGEAYPQQVAVSQETSCARFTDGTVHCTGDNTHGQLGRTDFSNSFGNYFERATGFTGHAVQVAVSDDTTCALVQGGTVSCWGGNENGELGQGTTDDEPHPQPVLVAF